MTKTIIFDIDNALLQWSTGFLEWCKEEVGLDVNPYAKIKQYDMRCVMPASSHDDIKDLIEEFNSSPEFGMLRPEPGAQQAMKDLFYELDDTNFVALTCSASSPASVLYRAQNMQMFPWLDELHIQPLGEDKKDLLDGLRDGSIAPAIINFDDDLEALSPEISDFIRRNYRPSGVCNFWKPK